MCRQALERRVSFGPPLICSWSDCPRREKRYTDTKAHSYSHWTGGRPRCLPQGEPPACSRRGLDVILSGLLAAATWVWFGWYGERSSTGPRRTDERSRRDRGGNDARKRFWGYCGTVVEDLFFFCSPLLQREMTQCEEEDRSGQDTETERQTDLILHQIWKTSEN